MIHDTAVTPHVRPPAPASVSEEARVFLSVPPPFGSEPDPDLGDTEGWLRWVEARNTGIRAYVAAGLPPEGSLARTELELGGVRTYVLRSPAIPEADEAPIFLDLHGGGLVLNGGDLAWMTSARNAVARQGVTWAPDFRNPPLHPYPAALDDCLAVYRCALEKRSPKGIVVHGRSGGGNLAAALLLRARDEGLPMPAALVLLTPELDLTESGDSFRTNLGIDHLGSLMQLNLLYANGHELAHPYLSPLFGDLSGFPPTFLQTGTRDLYLSTTVRMHRRLLTAGVHAELHVFEAMPHGGFGGQTPEDLELAAAARRFERLQLEAHGRP